MRDSGERTEAEYCAVNELPGSDCLNFMMYTLIKGIEDIERRLGPYDEGKNTWRYGSLTTVRFEHQPFSETLLRSLFDDTVEGQGNRRTANLFFDLPNIKERYEGMAGPIFRFVADFAD